MSAPVTQPQLHFNQLVLRDGQQSTLKPENINFNPIDWAKILSKVSEAGFQAAEVAGGQSFQSAIKQGLNPFNVMEYLDLSTRDANGNRTIDLQMLFRGANALGFKHYSPDVIEALLKEFTDLGINKIRIFDALNDIDNIYIPQFLLDRAKLEDSDNRKVELQGALCFGNYKQAPDRYTNEYYLNYAKALLDKGCTSLAIKDMSGQLDAQRAESLIRALVERFPSISIELHIHSTDDAKSLGAIRAAIAAKVDGIETVEGPLKKGASHHDLASIHPNYRELTYRTEAYRALTRVAGEVFTGVAREDRKVSNEIKAKLCAVGVPGGAMPFVLNDLRRATPQIIRNYVGALLKDQQPLQHIMRMSPDEQFNKAIELFLEELPRVCNDAAYPLLVTPTADICAKQAIYNLQYGSKIGSEDIEERYDLVPGHCDKRFVELVLGHYGQMKSYSSAASTQYTDIESAKKAFFQTNQLEVSAIDKQPYLKKLQEHVAGNGELKAAFDKADKLIEKYSHQAFSFASREQLALMYVMAPAGGFGDPIEKSLKEYTARVSRDCQWARKLGIPFDGFEYLFEPLFKHIDVLTSIGKRPADPLSMKISDFGKLGGRMYEVYSNLPQVKVVRDFIRTNERLSSGNLAINYQLLKENFESLFKQGRDFANTSLREMIADLIKLDKIRELLRPSVGLFTSDAFIGALGGIKDSAESQYKTFLSLLQKTWD